MMQTDYWGQLLCQTEWLERVMASWDYFYKSLSLLSDSGPRRAKQPPLYLSGLSDKVIHCTLEWSSWDLLPFSIVWQSPRMYAFLKKCGVSRLTFQGNYFEWSNNHLCVWILQCSLRKPHSLLYLYLLYLQVQRPYRFSHRNQWLGGYIN